MNDDKPNHVIKITAVKNGPVRLECEEVEIILPNGKKVTKNKTIFLCRCSCSKHQPFCDGAHKAFKFEK